MSDIAASGQAIQSEPLQFSRPVSEAALQAIGGSVNFCLTNVLPVGSVIYSMLDESTFQSETSTGWILCDGRNVAGSRYQTLTGNSNVPDARGVFIRGKNYSRSTSTGDTDGDRTLAAYQADGVRDHVHGQNCTFLNFNPGSGEITQDFGSEFARVEPANTGSITSGIPKAESRPRNIALNSFIRIN